MDDEGQYAPVHPLPVARGCLVMKFYRYYLTSSAPVLTESIPAGDSGYWWVSKQTWNGSEWVNTNATSHPFGG